MEASKEYLKKNNIVPTISFKDGTAHTVKLVQDKLDTITGNDGKDVEGVAFLVEEDGEKKRFFTSSVSLIQKLSSVESGSTVTIQMKKSKGQDGKYKSYYEVNSGSASASTNDDEVSIEEANELFGD